jgi:ankyrin repeat protein
MRLKSLIDAALGLVLIGSIGCAGYSFSRLHTAARNGEYGEVKKLIAEGENVNQYIDGWTPLLWAVFYKCAPVVQLLLENGADPDLELKKTWSQTQTSVATGSTPLIVACYYGMIPIVEMLLHANADRERKNDRGYSALDYARYYRFAEIVELLSRK